MVIIIVNNNKQGHFVWLVLLYPFSLLSSVSKKHKSGHCKQKTTKIEKLSGTETSYLVPLDAWQRGPAMWLTVGLTVCHLWGYHRTGPPAPFKYRDLFPGSSHGGAALLVSPLVGKELVSIPRQQDAQHSNQVRYVRSPSGPNFLQRKEWDSPDKADEKYQRYALIQPCYHECTGGHAEEHDHGCCREWKQLLICPVHERPRRCFAQVAQG